MDKAIEQGGRPSSVVQGAATRAMIMTATVALIAEVGWGQVTTRAIATRAGVPHGAVSYHFRGKDDLLRQAAIAGTLQALAEPLALARQARDVHEVLEGTLAWFASGGLRDPSTVLLLETLRQSMLDSALREPIATALRTFRAELTELVRRDQESGEVVAGPPAAGTAVLVAALMDGLLMHMILDPELDIANAAEAARTLLRGG